MDAFEEFLNEMKVAVGALSEAVNGAILDARKLHQTASALAEKLEERG